MLFNSIDILNWLLSPHLAAGFKSYFFTYPIMPIILIINKNANLMLINISSLHLTITAVVFCKYNRWFMS